MIRFPHRPFPPLLQIRTRERGKRSDVVKMKKEGREMESKSGGIY